MKKFILLGLAILFLSSCSDIVRSNKVDGIGSIYLLPAFSYNIEIIKNEFPNFVLITRNGNRFYVYTKE